MDNLHSDAQFGEETLIDFILGLGSSDCKPFTSSRRELTIDWYQPSTQFVPKLLQTFVQNQTCHRSHPPSFGSTLIRLPSIAPALTSVEELHIDYDSLQDALASVEEGRLFELTRLHEEKPFLRRCPSRHPLDQISHPDKLEYPDRNVYPTPCVSTLYELRGKYRQSIYTTNCSVLRIELVRCELRDHCVTGDNYRHLYADEISLTITSTGTF